MVSHEYLKKFGCLIFLGLGLIHATAFAEVINKPAVSTLLPNAKKCGQCHKAIYQQWHNSFHAQSTPAADKIVAAFYRYLQKKGVDTQKCDKCHMPLQAIFRTEALTKQNMEVFNDGVSCIVCHSIEAVHAPAKIGVEHYRLNFDNVIKGPIADPKDNLHPADYITLFKKVDICIGCHVGQTDDYFKTDQQQNLTPCQNCHMPARKNQRLTKDSAPRNKVYQHIFLGGHNQELLEASAQLELNVAEEGQGYRLTVGIESTSRHPIPTGFPLRIMFLKVIALNENETAVWTNIIRDPDQNNADSVIGLGFNSVEEGIFAHFVNTVKPQRDQRLFPEKQLKLSYYIENKTITHFQAQLYYRLLPLPVVKALGLTEVEVPLVLMSEEMIEID